MADEPPLNLLFVTVAKWAGTQGAGLWRGETSEWDVAFNGHDVAIDGLPAYSVKLEHKRYLWIAVLYPYGGVIGGMGEDGEQQIMAHFEAAMEQAA